MANTSTPYMGYLVPARGDVDWDDEMLSNYNAQDISIYAAREDRNLTISGGGVMTYSAGTGQIAFTSDIYIHHGVSGFRSQIPVSQSPLLVSTALRLVYAVIPRSPTSLTVMTTLNGKLFNDQTACPKSDYALVIAIRDAVTPTNKVQLFGGGVLLDGIPGALGSGSPVNGTTVAPRLVSAVSDPVTSADYLVYFDATSNSIAESLPNPTTVPNQLFKFKRLDYTGNTVTLTPTAGLIEGAPNQLIPGGAVIALRAYGSNYVIEEY